MESILDGVRDGPHSLQRHPEEQCDRTADQAGLLSLGHEQLPLVLDAEPPLNQVEVPIQIDDGPADVTVGRIPSHVLALSRSTATVPAAYA